MHRWYPKRVRTLVLLARSVLLVVALHLGGVLHGAVDFVRTCEGVALHESDDCGDGEDHCPADCPNCHCGHGGARALPPAAPAPEVLALVTPGFVRVDPAGAAPPARPLPPLYRPPRARLS